MLVVKFAPGRAARSAASIVASHADLLQSLLQRPRFRRRRRWSRRSAPAPIKSARSSPGRYIAFQRVPDYWAKDLPVNVGQANFDVIRFEYFGDRRSPSRPSRPAPSPCTRSSPRAIWATGYDFPAFHDGRVKREEIPDDSISGHPGLVLQYSPAQLFKDPRVREALGYAFDFEWTQPQSDVRRLQAHHILFRELATSRPQACRPSRARLCSNPSAIAAARGFRRALPAAGFGRLGTGSQLS